MQVPFLIVGLGNPGPEYENTPHNLGFHVADEIAIRLNAGFTRKGKSLRCEATLFGRKIILLKPQTYMNLSGEAVRETVDFYKLNPSKDVLVLLDDLDLPKGSIRIRLSGSAGGHRGLDSVLQHLGDSNVPRLRIGIGRDEKLTAKTYVLKQITKREMKSYGEVVHRSADAALDAAEKGITHAMNSFNSKESV